ncbi:MAG: hypothetical protein J6Q78_02790 [Clostridia bacterium]|nr:hypothetical protein [Clostridia bacterium]
MTSQDLIYEFQSNNSVILDTDRIKTSLTSLLSKIEDNKTREERIGDFIKHEYPKIAEVFEFNKARGILMQQSDVSTTSSLELFEGYVNIISEIVKETSDALEAQAKEDRKKAEEALQEAKTTNDKAQKKYQNAQEMDMNKETGKNIDRDFVLNEYKKEVDNSAIALSNAEKKLAGVAPFKPYESSMDYFGISEEEAKYLLENQVNSATYINARRVQVATVGVADPVFMADLNEAFKNKVSYQEASASEKRRMQQVYATKQVMKETLDSKKGFWGWVWKAITHRSEAKAMRNYINAADRSLSGANFDTKAENEAIEAMTKKGYLYGIYKRSGAESEIKEKFAENERKYASIREEQAKIEAKTEVEIEAISKLPLKDQFFEIKFRPSHDNETFEKQRLEYNEVAKIVSKGVKSNTIPKDVIEVFKATTKKFNAVKKIKAGVPVESCEEIEQVLMDKGNHDNYNAMKFSEVKNLVEQKESISIPLDNPNANLNVSKPVETAPQLDKDPIIKNN